MNRIIDAPDFHPFLERNPAAFEQPAPSLLTRLRNALVQAVAPTPFVRGVDLSHHNGVIDFPALKASGIDFVYLKVSEADTFKDDTFQARWPAALEAGVLVGGYHFFRGNFAGSVQANNFIEALQPYWEASGHVMLPPMLDIETRDGATNTQIINRALAWLQTIQAQFNRQPGIYSSPYFWSLLLSPTPNWTTNYLGWVAHWTSAAAPVLPNGWTGDMTRFWQYGIYGAHSWVTPVSGVESAEVDVDWFFGTLDELRDLAGYVEPPPPPPSSDLEQRVAALELGMAELAGRVGTLEGSVGSLWSAIQAIQAIDGDQNELLGELVESVAALEALPHLSYADIEANMRVKKV